MANATNSKNYELKPCPFCGTEADPDLKDGHGNRWWLICTHCHATGAEGNTPEGCYEAWNTRAYEKQIEALTEALDHIIGEHMKALHFGEQEALKTFEWQTMDNAPKDGTHILLYDDGGATYRGASNGVQWFACLGYQVDFTPRPLLWTKLSHPTAPLVEEALEIS